MSLLCAPYLYYNVRLYTRKQHLVDVTEIFNLLHWEKKQRLFKLAYLVVLLFFSIFWMIWSALEDIDMINGENGSNEGEEENKQAFFL